MPFSETIRTMFIKKYDKKERQDKFKEKLGEFYNVNEAKKLEDVYSKFQITVFAGTRTITICSMDDRGQIQIFDEHTAKGRILKIEEDQKYDYGMLLLMDMKPETE